jgi:hypothetical protein
MNFSKTQAKFGEIRQNTAKFTETETEKVKFNFVAARTTQFQSPARKFQVSHNIAPHLGQGFLCFPSIGLIRF